MPEDTAVAVADPEVPAEPFAENLDSLNRDQLHAILRDLGLPAPGSLRKDDLIQWVRTGRELREGRPAIEAAVAAVPALAEPPMAVLPAQAKWDQIQQMAAYLAKSSLTPDALRGHPHELGHILLKANDLGIPLTAAVDQLYVIQGRVGMESKLMRALIRRDGHSIRDLGCDGYRARVHGRHTNGDEHTGEFTLDDAIDFELIKGYTIEHGENGDRYVIDPITRSGNSGSYEPKPQWRKDTKNMLTERATSRLAWFLFPECLAGVSYTPDEIDFGYLEEAGAAAPRGKAGEPEPTMTANEQRSLIAERIELLPDDIKGELRETWKSRRLPGPKDLRPGAIRTALGLLEDAEAKAEQRHAAEHANIEEADVVKGDDELMQPCAGCDSTVSLCDDGTWAHDEEGHGDHEPRPVTSEGDAGVGEPVTEATDTEPGAGDVGADQGGTCPANGQPDTASPAPPLGEPAIACAGCGEVIPEQTQVIWDDQDRPYHLECGPM